MAPIGWLIGILARPFVVPTLLVSTGLYYGVYDISYLISKLILGREKSDTILTNIAGQTSAVGLISLRSRFNPFKLSQSELWNDFSIKALKSASFKPLIRYHVLTICLSSCVAGITTSIFSPLVVVPVINVKPSPPS